MCVSFPNAKQDGNYHMAIRCAAIAKLVNNLLFLNRYKDRKKERKSDKIKPYCPVAYTRTS